MHCKPRSHSWHAQQDLAETRHGAVSPVRPQPSQGRVHKASPAHAAPATCKADQVVQIILRGRHRGRRHACIAGTEKAPRSERGRVPRSALLQPLLRGLPRARLHLHTISVCRPCPHHRRLFPASPLPLPREELLVPCLHVPPPRNGGPTISHQRHPRSAQVRPVHVNQRQYGAVVRQEELLAVTELATLPRPVRLGPQTSCKQHPIEAKRSLRLLLPVRIVPRQLRIPRRPIIARLSQPCLRQHWLNLLIAHVQIPEHKHGLLSAHERSAQRQELAAPLLGPSRPPHQMH